MAAWTRVGSVKKLLWRSLWTGKLVEGERSKYVASCIQGNGSMHAHVDVACFGIAFNRLPVISGICSRLWQKARPVPTKWHHHFCGCTCGWAHYVVPKCSCIYLLCTWCSPFEFPGLSGRKTRQTEGVWNGCQTNACRSVRTGWSRVRTATRCWIKYHRLSFSSCQDETTTGDPLLRVLVCLLYRELSSQREQHFCMHASCFFQELNSRWFRNLIVFLKRLANSKRVGVWALGFLLYVNRMSKPATVSRILWGTLSRVE
jgi:hypothetical protein